MTTKTDFYAIKELSGLINHVTSIWRIRRRACRRLISLRSIWTQ